ncbi:secretoglobin family 3A member 1 [Tupaia chinensis]|uniref:secretoglobin family 3A member 1 n=1 Tax=Tupaia chinensis TaxID=246437 RepID=UPI000703D3F6|nr:secretoglobin family 3A member 1 [Tupaia chinensis]
MKLAAAFPVLCVALLGASAAAFLVDSLAQPVAAVGPVAEAVATGAGRVLPHWNPLELVLSRLGFPMEQLAQSCRQCVAELGPEVVKTLLAAPALFG